MLLAQENTGNTKRKGSVLSIDKSLRALQSRIDDQKTQNPVGGRDLSRDETPSVADGLILVWRRMKLRRGKEARRQIGHTHERLAFGGEVYRQELLSDRGGLGNFGTEIRELAELA